MEWKGLGLFLGKNYHFFWALFSTLQLLWVPVPRAQNVLCLAVAGSGCQGRTEPPADFNVSRTDSSGGLDSLPTPQRALHVYDSEEPIPAKMGGIPSGWSLFCRFPASIDRFHAFSPVGG